MRGDRSHGSWAGRLGTSSGQLLPTGNCGSAERGENDDGIGLVTTNRHQADTEDVRNLSRHRQVHILFGRTLGDHRRHPPQGRLFVQDRRRPSRASLLAIAVATSSVKSASRASLSGGSVSPGRYNHHTPETTFDQDRGCRRRANSAPANCVRDLAFKIRVVVDACRLRALVHSVNRLVPRATSASRAA